MKSAFLDANVLFSACYSTHSSLLRLWKLRGVRLCASAFALEETRRNLRDESALTRLQDLHTNLTIIAEADVRLIPASVTLRPKDKPILSAAIAAKLDYLLTGDSQDFGTFFGKTIAGVMILRPRDFIALMAKEAK